MSVKEAIDSVIEAPVVTSYTKLGYLARRQLFDWQPLDGYDLTGQTMVLTGGTSGLGLAAARRLADLGADLLVVGRNPEKLEGVIDAIGAEGVVADMGDLDVVRQAAAEIAERRARVHVLIHNAGALTADRRTAPDGTELTVASQVLGPFLLTALLVQTLQAAAPARVLTMASGGMYSQPLRVDQLEMGADDYKGTTAYARAKRAQVTLNEMWAERLAGTGVVTHALHPGWADTPGVRDSLPTFRKVVGPALRTPDEGADTLVWLAADDEPLQSTGKFWLDRRPRSIHRLATTRRSDTPEERQRLWDWCVERTGWEN